MASGDWLRQLFRGDANFRPIFDFIQRGRWTVLFDEFDAIGKDRNILLPSSRRRLVT
jgi:hypothetical protein